MIGRTISHYRIIDELGKGGMGVVYRAEDTRLGRTVAVKVMSAGSGDATAKRRFVQEAQAASSLEHPNICVIHEIDETPQGDLFIVMPRYGGESLQETIARGPMAVSDAVAVAVQVAAGLAKAHEKGIVHRDIKPGNILVTEDGVAKIVDFGLAKLAGGARLTRTGAIAGTVAYMSPEQLRGGDVDARSDIWALGVLLYEMLTGALPFPGDYEQALMYAITSEAPASIAEARPDVPAALADIVTRALAKDRSARFDTAAEMKAALELLSQPSGISAGGGDRRLPSIAVLPFANMSPDPENRYFGDGLTEELINALAQVEGLRVAARTSAFRFRGEGVDLREVGKTLNVETVLEGSVRKAGNRLRITAQLINIEDGYHLWSKRFDREMADIFDIQDEIARSIVEQLKVTLVGASGDTLVSAGTENLDAYTALLEGRYYLHSLTPEGWAKSLELLEKSAALDPAFALPHAYLADYYQSLAWWGNRAPTEVMPRSGAEALRAIELDDSLGLAHGNLAIVRFFYEWNDVEAEREFDRAAALDPSAGATHVYRALFYSCAGRAEDAVSDARVALKLEPLDGLMAAWAASALVGAGAVQEAIETIRRAMSMDQEHWQLQLFMGFAQLHEGRPGEAATALERALELSGGASIVLSALGVARYAAGETAQGEVMWRRLIERGGEEYVSPGLVAGLANARGDRQAVRVYMERAVDVRDPFLRTDRIWPPQSRISGPELDALLVKAGLR